MTKFSDLRFNFGNGYAFAEDYEKVINRKKYSTYTAELINWHWEPREYKGTFLFRKRTGELFSYVIEYSNYNIRGRHNVYCRLITPLTEEAAKNLVEEHWDAGTYEELFGEVEE